MKYIPAVNHHFYKQLKCNSSRNGDDDDGGGSGSDVWTESDTDDA